MCVWERENQMSSGANTVRRWRRKWSGSENMSNMKWGRKKVGGEGHSVVDSVSNGHTRVFSMDIWFKQQKQKLDEILNAN